MRFDPNVGEIDGNVRKFLAVPCAVLTITSAMAYHAYPFAAIAALFGVCFLASGTLHRSPTYFAFGWSTIGGPHRTRGSHATH